MYEGSQPPEDLEGLSKLAVDDHRRLQGILRGIAECDDFSELAQRVDDLHLVLERHFAHEEVEDEGLFAIVETRAVQLHGKVEELREEHRKLRAELAELCARVQDCAAADQALVRAKVTAFTKWLRDHEARETELFMDSWNTDLGAKD